MKNTCPSCGYNTDTDVPMSGENITPEVGDVTLCGKCGGIHEFDNDMKLIKITESKLSKIDPDELQQLAFFQKVIRSKEK